MMEWSQWIEFTKFGVGSAPKTIGVYCLSVGDEVVYIGKAEGQDGILGRLHDHLSGNEGDCTRLASRYRYRECSDPMQEEFLLID